MLVTGKPISSHGMKKGNSGPEGFTLIELTMVILLLGMFLSLTLPHIGDTILHDGLKKSSRRLIGYITELRNMAIQDNIDHYLFFDIDSNKLWIDSPVIDEEDEEDEGSREMEYTFPGEVRIVDILFRDEMEKTSGITRIRFTREGYIRPSIIHLGSEDGRKFTLVLSPFLGNVQLFEDYMDFEDVDEEI